MREPAAIAARTRAGIADRLDQRIAASWPVGIADRPTKYRLDDPRRIGVLGEGDDRQPGVAAGDLVHQRRDCLVLVMDEDDARLRPAPDELVDVLERLRESAIVIEIIG